MTCENRRNKRERAASSVDFNSRKLRRLDFDAHEQASSFPSIPPTDAPVSFVPEKSPPAYTVDADDILRMFYYRSPPPSPPAVPMRPSRLVKPEGFLGAITNPGFMSNRERAPLSSGLYRDSAPRSTGSRQRSPARPEYMAYRLDAYRTPSPAPAPVAFDMSPSDCQPTGSSSSSQVCSPYRITACEHPTEGARAPSSPSLEPPSNAQLLPPPSPLPMPITEGSVEDTSPTTAIRVANVSTRAPTVDRANLAPRERPRKKARIDAGIQPCEFDFPSESAISARIERYESSSQCSENIAKERSPSPPPRRMRQQRSTRYIVPVRTPKFRVNEYWEMQRRKLGSMIL